MIETFKVQKQISLFDEFVKPIVIVNEEDNPVAAINSNDSVIYYNFRPDRARQPTKSFILDNFDGFERKDIQNLYFVTMTEYD